MAIKTTIKSRYMQIEICINNNNTLSYRRILVMPDSINFAGKMPNLSSYLQAEGVSYWSSSCAWKDIKSTSEIMPKTLEIEREIDRAMGEYAGIRKSLEAELEALTPPEIKISEAVNAAVLAERDRIKTALPKNQYYESTVRKLGL